MNASKYGKIKPQKQNAGNLPGEWDLKSGATQVRLLPARFTFRDKFRCGRPEEETHANFLQEMPAFKQSILYKVALTKKKKVFTNITQFLYFEHR